MNLKSYSSRIVLNELNGLIPERLKQLKAKIAKRLVYTSVLRL